MTVEQLAAIAVSDMDCPGIHEPAPVPPPVQQFSDFRLLERSLAYTVACSLIETNCVPVGNDWFDRSDFDPHAAGPVADALLYLNLRGLLEQHPDEPAWVALRDESEEL